MSRAGDLISACRTPGRRGFTVALPLVLLGGLTAGAEGAASVPEPPAGTASAHPAPGWLAALTGPVLTDRGVVPATSLPPGAPVVPVGGDPKNLVLAKGPGPVASTSPGTAGPDAALTAGLTSSGIPVRVLQAYLAAASVLAERDPGCHLSWSLLAGIGRVESNHARYGGAGVLANGAVTPPIYGPVVSVGGGSTRAVGPMQFLPGTWAVYGADGNGDGVADPQNIDDATLGAARYLCAGGADLSTQSGRWNAVFRYNHSDSYVSLVLALADSYASGTPTALPGTPAGTQPPAGPPANVGPPPAVPLPPAPPSGGSGGSGGSTVTATSTSSGPNGTGTPTGAATGSPSQGSTGSPTTGPTTTAAPPSDATTPTGTATPTDTSTANPSATSTSTPAPSATSGPTDTATPTDSSTTTSTATTTTATSTSAAAATTTATDTSTGTPTTSPT